MESHGTKEELCNCVTFTSRAHKTAKLHVIKTTHHFWSNVEREKRIVPVCQMRQAKPGQNFSAYSSIMMSLWALLLLEWAAEVAI